MRYVAVETPGAAECMLLEDGPIPVPQSDEILIEVEYAGINRPDILQRKGLYPPPPGASDLPGLEVSGTVVATGPGVDRKFLQGMQHELKFRRLGRDEFVIVLRREVSRQHRVDRQHRLVGRRVNVVATQNMARPFLAPPGIPADRLAALEADAKAPRPQPPVEICKTRSNAIEELVGLIVTVGEHGRCFPHALASGP